MRASHQEQTGAAGVNRAAADFEDIGWGPIVNTLHDLGTDLFLQVRDQALDDIGVMVGAQVKAGDTYFRDAELAANGELTGWWFRTDRKHIEAWLAHSVPHLIVLRRQASDSPSYWAHVTDDAVTFTESGAKILIPVANTVDLAHRDTLLKIAATGRSGITWEGSAWSGARRLAPHEMLRYALIVPRLVSPHQNASRTHAPEPARAIAMLAQGRVGELQRLAQLIDDMPTPEEAELSTDWSWQLFGALWRRTSSGRLDALAARAEDAPDAGCRAAATASAASALIENGHAEEAIDLIDTAFSHADAHPIDEAWLRMQRARARAEIGRLDEARSDALDVQDVGIRYPRDATASAIAGSATVFLFNTSSWGQQDVQEAVAGSDTAANWWRAQTTSRGLEDSLERTFKTWARDTAVTIGGRDKAKNQLHAAALAASHAGDQPGWRHLTSLGGQHALARLDRHADPQIARDGLRELTRAGDHDALQLAGWRLLADGPARGLVLASMEIDPRASTRTTGRCDLTLLRLAGELVSEVCADETAGWLLATLNDPSAFLGRTKPSYDVHDKITAALAAVLPAASITANQAAMKFLLEQPASDNQVWATNWARVARAVREDAWDDATAAQAIAAAADQDWSLRLPLLAAAAPRSREARSALHEEIRSGSLFALAELGDPTALPTDVARVAIDRLSHAAERTIVDAQRGVFGIGMDVAGPLALLNVLHPGIAEWDGLLSMLAHGSVASGHKAGAFSTLALYADRIPDEVRQRLRAIATDVAVGEQRTVALPLDEPGHAAGQATCLAAAIGALDPSVEADCIASLLRGGTSDRKWAAFTVRYIETAESAGTLAALSSDPQPEVRAAAAAGLARLAVAGVGGPQAASALRACLDDPGIQVPAQMAATLGDLSGPAADHLREPLRGHQSARVRRMAGREASTGRHQEPPAPTGSSL